MDLPVLAAARDSQAGLAAPVDRVDKHLCFEAADLEARVVLRVVEDSREADYSAAEAEAAAVVADVLAGKR